MRGTRIAKLVLDIRSGFWLRPILMLAAGVALSVAATRLDHWLIDAGRISPLGRDVSPGGARALLSVAAGALATTLAISLSATMVTVQLASSQYTPRLLRRFLSDRFTQGVLGVFLGTISFLFLVLRAVRSPDEGASFVPVLSLSLGAFATLVCLGLLVVFLHRTMRAMQASTIIASIGRQTVIMIEGTAPVGLRRLTASPDGPCQVVRADAAGYVQLLDDASMRSSIPPHVAIRREVNPGDFVLPGTPLVTVYRSEPLPNHAIEAVRRSLTLGSERTTESDSMFGVRQLVDMALKALSPGINDVTTAVMVVNELGVIGRAVAATGLAEDVERARADEHAGLYVTRDLSFERYLEVAFGEIVAAATTQPRVHRRILDILTTIESVEPELAPIVRTFARRITDLSPWPQASGLGTGFPSRPDVTGERAGRPAHRTGR